MTQPDNTPQDPFQRLSPYEKKLILYMVPTWSERRRMRNPRLSKAEREHLLLAILLERRRLYERYFKQECSKNGDEPPTVRNLLSHELLRRYQAAMNAAIAAAADHRMSENQNAKKLRQAAENHRRDKLGLPPLTDEEHRKRRQKRKTLRMSP